jgi:hypothetical protein
MRTVEPAIQRATMRSVIAGYECKGLRAGRAPLFDWRVREGIEQHVDSAANEGVSVELLHHIAPHFKNELQLLQTEETGWTLVAICIWVEQWGLSLGSLSWGVPPGQCKWRLPWLSLDL